MPHIIEITDLSAPELAPYTRLTEAQLRNKLEPEKGIFIAESPKVIGTALDAGCEPLSFLMERRQIDGPAAGVLARCPDAAVYTADRSVLQALTGYALTRGVLCAMRRPQPRSVEALCRDARRVAVLEGIVDSTNIGAIFRSAAALNMDAVLVTPSCCDPLCRRAVRVSMGTVFQVPWTQIGSTAADWPEQGMQQLHALGFKTAAMALTDHDTIEGIPEAVQAASEQNLELVPGVELSTFWDEKEIHIVGLFIDYTDKTFQKELESLRDVRRNRNIAMCEKFTQLGIPIDYSDMEKEYADAVITRAHFADYLLKKGYIKSRNEAFDRYIGSNGPCYVPRKKMPCAEAIRLIKNAGGVPILAHPVLYHLGKEPMNKLMDYLCDSGIVGLEAIYSTYTAGEEIQMKKLASERGLILSGGSDYHGANKPHIELGIGRGHLFVPYSLLDEIKKHRR